MNTEAFLSLSYGLYLVSSSLDKQPCAYVANTVFQLTASPPLLGISCHSDNLSFHAIRQSKAFNVSVLQKYASIELIRKFGYKSGHDLNKFDHVNYKSGANGLPVILQDCMAFFECRLEKEIDLGTHFLFIGLVEVAEWLNPYTEPITYAYYRENYRAFSPKNSPTFQAQEAGVERKAASERRMKRYVCPACGYIYDPETGDEDSGIDPGTAFEDIPDDWECPVCGVSKSGFILLD